MQKFQKTTIPHGVVPAQAGTSGAVYADREIPAGVYPRGAGMTAVGSA